MKHRLICGFLLCGTFAAAQSMFCSPAGNTVYCNDGTSATRSGNTLYFRDGAAAARAANTVDVQALLPASRAASAPDKQARPLEAPVPGPERQGWDVPLDEALQKVPTQLLVSFVRQCMSAPLRFRDQSAHLRRPLEEELIELDGTPLPQQEKAAIRESLQASLAKIGSQPVPKYFRIDSADDFKQCLEAHEQHWQDALLLSRRHKNYLHMDEATRVAMAEYLNAHFEVPRFVVFTLAQNEEAYNALTAAGKFHTQK